MFLKLLQVVPVIIFFVCYKTTNDLVLATTLIVISCVIASAIEYVLTKTISRMQIFMLVAILALGLPTILLKDPAIIKWKVTVVNFILALALFVFQYILKKNPFAYLLGKEIPLPDEVFKIFANCYMVFFVLAGLLNIVIAFYLPSLFDVTEAQAEDIWVSSKSYGNAIINFVYTLIVLGYLMKKYPKAFSECGTMLKNDKNQKQHN